MPQCLSHWWTSCLWALYAIVSELRFEGDIFGRFLPSFVPILEGFDLVFIAALYVESLQGSWLLLYVLAVLNPLIRLILEHAAIFLPAESWVLLHSDFLLRIWVPELLEVLLCLLVLQRIADRALQGHSGSAHVFAVFGPAQPWFCLSVATLFLEDWWNATLLWHKFPFRASRVQAILATPFSWVLNKALIGEDGWVLLVND